MFMLVLGDYVIVFPSVDLVDQKQSEDTETATRRVNHVPATKPHESFF